MLQPNCRIETFEGIRFYEKDILYDDYVYSNDMKIVLDVNYMTPGIGIALMNNEGMPLQEQKDIYMFRLGYREATVIYRFGDVVKKLSTSSNTLFPSMENMKITFSKIGRRVTVSVDEYGTLIDYLLPINIDKYSIGFYSNAGNILKNINIASSIPDFWNVNMMNTNGGHLRFFKNGFSLINCKNKAELEQSDIELKAGTYTIKYDVIEPSDIQCYVMMSGDERPTYKEKNILLNNKFKLDEDGFVNVRFQGKYGTIQNIHIAENENDQYVPTKNAQATIEGSHIAIKTSSLNIIEWKGTILQTPSMEDTTSSSDSAIFISETEVVPNTIPGVLSNKEYTYTYDVVKHSLTIADKDKIVYTHPFSYPTNLIVLFKNIDAIISHLVLTREDGEVINFIAKETEKRFVPASITSPIIVVDEENVPLELSSSYRIVKQENVDKYIFTNWEREVFYPSNKIRLEKFPSQEQGSIKIYGIPLDAKIDNDNIFRIPKEGMDTISLFTNKFKLIKEIDLHFLDRLNGEIYFNDYDEYQLFVVDYLKRDTYCINLIHDKNMYEVDISSDIQNTFIVYDYKQDSGDNEVSYISNYKMTDISPENKSYIVLRREGF